MRVVVKHEAMAIRKARAASVDAQDTDFDASEAHGLREVSDTVAGEERVGRSVEALKALKPDEARALLLKAEGLSYDEIGRRFGWTYTKVNRSIAEGRKRFLNVFSEIESGEACAAYEDTLDALARGQGHERADGLDPPAPAPLRGVPGDRAPDALLAHATDRAARAVRVDHARALSARGRYTVSPPPTAVGGSGRRRASSACA